jgi:hypothetical protein
MALTKRIEFEQWVADTGAWVPDVRLATALQVTPSPHPEATEGERRIDWHDALTDSWRNTPRVRGIRIS